MPQRKTTTPTKKKYDPRVMLARMQAEGQQQEFNQSPDLMSPFDPQQQHASLFEAFYVLPEAEKREFTFE